MNPITWVEIPVSEMDRAVTFYNKVFNFDLKIMDLGELKMAQFPGNPDGRACSGALVLNKEFYNSDAKNGPLVYFICSNVSNTLKVIQDNGGEIVIKEKLISPEYGSMGVALDSEGNRIALHASPKK